jgi:CysZ protein
VVLSRTPSLWGYVVIPVLVNLLVGTALYLGLLLTGLRYIDALIAGLPAWAAVLAVLLRVLLVLGLLLAIGFVVARFGVVLGAPWYARLSVRLEQLRTAQPRGTRATGIVAAARELAQALLYELKKLLLVLAVGVLLLLLTAVPAVGPVLASAGGVALGATITCLDFLDAPLERRGFRFRSKLGVVYRTMPASAGFGLAGFGLVSIPFLNLLFIPLCVAAGTLFFCDRVWPDLEATHR